MNLNNIIIIFFEIFIFCLLVVSLYFIFLNRKIQTPGIAANILLLLKQTFSLSLWILFSYLLSFSLLFYMLGFGYLVLSKFTLMLYSFICTILIITLVYSSSITLLIIKKSRIIKMFYCRQKKRLFILKVYFERSFIKLIELCSLIYKKYLLIFMLSFLSFTLIFKTYILFFSYCIYLLQQIILDLPFFKGFREEHNEDEATYSFHWANDRDLVFFNFFLSKLTYLSYFLTLFSYFLKLTPLINADALYSLECGNLLTLIDELQSFLAFKLVGPLLYLFSGFLRLLLGLHVIFFRNPRTKKPLIAVAKLSLRFVKLYGTVVATGTVVAAGFVEYRTGGINSKFKKTVDHVLDGVIRITQDHEREFTFLKDKGIKIPRDDMRELGNHIFDKSKVFKHLSLPENAAELSKLTPLELNQLDMVPLIPEDKVLLHNLQQYEKICAGKGHTSGYIYSFSGEERDQVLSGTKNSSNLDDFHHSIKRFVIIARSTPEGRTDYESFMSGKSVNLLIVWQNLKGI